MRQSQLTFGVTNSWFLSVKLPVGGLLFCKAHQVSINNSIATQGLLLLFQCSPHVLCFAWYKISRAGTVSSVAQNILSIYQQQQLIPNSHSDVYQEVLEELFNLSISEAYCVIIALHFPFFCCRRTISFQTGFSWCRTVQLLLKLIKKCLEGCGKITRSGRSASLMVLLKNIHHGSSGSPKEVVGYIWY